MQRELLARYHVTDAGDTFYGGSDFWKVPADPTNDADPRTSRRTTCRIAMPGQDDAAVLADDDVHADRWTREMPAGFLAVDSDAGTTRPASGGRLRAAAAARAAHATATSRVRGRCRTTSTRRRGPVRRASALDLSQFLNIQTRQSGKTRDLGNLLTLPVGGGLLYVEPIYVQANGLGPTR